MEYDLEKISSKIERKKTIKKVLKKIISILLIIVAVINIILLYYKVKGEDVPNVFGLYFFNIVSESMEPTFEKNDVIIVRKCDEKDFKKGDVITFLKNNKTISHRIIQIVEIEGGREFITQGDNNEIPDADVVFSNEIYGKVIGKISKMGSFVEYIQEKDGFIRIAILVIIGFILVNMNDEKKNRRKITRKKYEIKKKRDKYN